MLLSKLESIRDQVSRREMKLSDALLLALRCLRGTVSSDKLIWVNRELLGYRPDDLDAQQEREDNDHSTILGFFRPWSIEPPRKVNLEMPRYRFLSGIWGRIDRAGRLVTVMEPELAQRQIFCNIGIQQIEIQLEEMENPTEALFSLSFDERYGAEFFCESAELIRVYDHVRFKLVDFIDRTIDELDLRF